jgi:hypothetical protein
MVLMILCGSKGYPFDPILCIACTFFLIVWCLSCWPLFKLDLSLLQVEEVPMEGVGASSAPSWSPLSRYSKRRGTSGTYRGQKLTLVIYLREPPRTLSIKSGCNLLTSILWDTVSSSGGTRLSAWEACVSPFRSKSRSSSSSPRALFFGLGVSTSSS